MNSTKIFFTISVFVNFFTTYASEGKMGDEVKNSTQSQACATLRSLLHKVAPTRPIPFAQEPLTPRSFEQYILNGLVILDQNIIETPDDSTAASLFSIQPALQPMAVKVPGTPDPSYRTAISFPAPAQLAPLASLASLDTLADTLPAAAVPEKKGSPPRKSAYDSALDRLRADSPELKARTSGVDPNVSDFTLMQSFHAVGTGQQLNLTSKTSPLKQLLSKQLPS